MSRAVAVRGGRSGRSAKGGGGGGPSVLKSVRNALAGYFKDSERPLASLAFVFPLVLFYEIGWRFAGSRLLAFNLIHQFFAMIGAPGTFIPAFTLIGILIAWHIANHDKWTINVNTLMGMAIESLILALPLLALAAGVSRWQMHSLLGVFGGGFGDRIIISVGAGIYEELLFRLIAMTTLHLLFVDILRMKKNIAGLLMVLISAILFSLYHYLGVERFEWKTCLFRTVAGIYFGGIFMCRGYGVTAGCHIFYDTILVVLSSY